MLVEFSGTTIALLSLVGIGIFSCCFPDQQQQQQITVSDDGSSERKRICPECGMENPRKANHCGDCGFAFKPSDKDNDE